MSEKQKISFHFDKENLRSFSVDDAEKVLKEVGEQKTGWYRIEDTLINLDNVTNIKLSKKIKSISF